MEQLYKDYFRMRDEYSLKIMRRYLDLALSVECDETGRIVISRALQVVGENLKNTLDSPKLSDTTCELLLFSLPENTREIVKGLRDSLSHAESMRRRTEIEKGDEMFFSRIKDDLKKLNIEIRYVQFQFRKRIILDDLKRIIECENEEELGEVFKSLNGMEYLVNEPPVVPKLSVVKKIDILLKVLRDFNFVEKTEKDIYIINKLNNATDIENNKLLKTNFKFINLFYNYKYFLFMCQQNTFENIRNQAKILLNDFFLESEDLYSGLKDNMLLLADNFINRTVECPNEVDQRKMSELFGFLLREFKRFTLFEHDKIKLIEDYNFDIRVKKRKSGAPHTQNGTELLVDPDTDINLISEKLQQLKNAESMFNDLVSFKNNSKYQAVVEMLVLDIYSLLGERLSYNQLFLCAEPVTLIGMNMRNHLAHENQLISIICSCSSIDLALNGKFLLEECTLNNERNIRQVCHCNINKLNIGKVFPSNIASLEVEHKHELGIIALQKEMFMALSNGDLLSFKNAVQKGADIQARYMGRKTALHFAIEGTSIETVKLVLDENCEFEASDEEGQSILHIATRHGRSKIVEYLIKNTSIFVDQLDRDRKTPLHIAAENGHLEVVEVLLNSGASTTVKDVCGWSPLHYSIKNNHKEIVKALLNKEDNVDENEGFGGKTPLHIASSFGHSEIVDYLIKERANVNAKTDTMDVPLHSAVEGGHLETVRTLIEKGASVNARDMHGTTALHKASSIGHESILRLLLENETNVDDVLNILKRSPLSIAAQYGHIKIVKLLLKHKAKVDMKDVTGRTPLHIAAEIGHQSIVEILVNKKEKDTTLAKKKKFFDEKDLLGQTALHYSASNGHESVVDLLLNEGSNIECIDICKNTPLISAVQNGHFNVFKVLINRNADINHTNILNETALHMCINRQYLDLASHLIKTKANIHEKSLTYGITPFHKALGIGSKSMIESFVNGGANIEDIKTSDFTALHLGIINGDLEVIKYLIDLKCDMNARSKSGLTALHLAVQQSSMAIIKLLRQEGSDLNIQDNEGYTPLCCAVRENNKKIIQYLIKEGATIKGDLLEKAVRSGSHDAVTILLDKGRFDVKVDNGSLLEMAIYYQHKNVAEILLEKGADINAKTCDITPLYVATLHANFEMVKFLLNKGADPNSPSLKEEITPLWIAVSRGFTDIVKILLEGGATTTVDSTNMSATQLAVECGLIKVVKFLLENKYGDVNETLYGKFSLLHTAVRTKNFVIIKYLVENGADINFADVMLAIESGQKDIVEFFHKFSARETFKDRLGVMCFETCGETFLHVASKFNQKEILLYFLENGAYYNAENQNGKTPLQVTKDSDIKCALQQVENVFNAIERNELELLNDAIKKGAILNARRNDDLTPLHVAARKGCGVIVNMLLDNGANPNIVEEFNIALGTPLHYAAYFGHFDIVLSLLSHGAIYNIQSKTGKTPLEYSHIKGFTRIARLLSLVDTSFKSVQIGKLEFLEEVKTLSHPEEIQSVMKSRNKEKKLLVTSAMCHDFPEIEQLKQILKVDTDSMRAVAKTHYAVGNYLIALKCFERILKIMSEGLGHDHPDTLNVKDDVGSVLLKMNNLDEALKVLEENLKNKKESLGDNHVSTLHTKLHLALTLCKLGQNTEALKMLRELYSQQIIILSKSDLKVLETQHVMAYLLFKEENYEEALHHFRMVNELYAELYGERNPNSIDIQVVMADILSIQEKFDDAIKQLQNPYDTQQIIEGKENHPNITEILFRTANVYFRAGNYDTAIKLYKDVVRLQNTDSKIDILDFNKMLDNLGEALVIKGNFLEAFKYYSKFKETDSSNFVAKKMESFKIVFRNAHGMVYGSVLEQIENDNSCAAEGGSTSLEEEERIQQASDIYLKLFKRQIYCPKYPEMCPILKDRSTEEMSENHFADHHSEFERFCAMEKTDTYLDMCVFLWMGQYKMKYLGIFHKFNGMSGNI